MFQSLAPRGASDLEPLWLRIQHYQPRCRQKLTETVKDSVQCNRDSVVKSVKSLSLDAIHMRFPHPPRTTSDQAARAHHGLLSKKIFCPLSSSQNLIRTSAGFSRNGQRLLCFHTDNRTPTQLTLPRATQIRPPRQPSQANVSTPQAGML